VCSDGIDNDADGNTDNADNECWFLPAPDPNSQDPPVSIYCPNWTDENHAPTNQQQCDGV
jgi:hypothetical protein